MSAVALPRTPHIIADVQKIVPVFLADDDREQWEIDGVIIAALEPEKFFAELKEDVFML